MLLPRIVMLLCLWHSVIPAQAQDTAADFSAWLTALKTQGEDRGLPPAFMDGNTTEAGSITTTAAGTSVS